MIYQIAKPSLPLSRFIKHYWTMESCVPAGEAHIQRIVPSGLPELVFYFGDKPKSANRNMSFSNNTLITGQQNNYYDMKISGKMSLFSIIFQPHGLSSFLDVPLQELNNQHVPLRFILRNDADVIESKLFEAKSFTKRIAIVERYFFKILENRGLSYDFNRISSSIARINQAGGLVNIDDLASEACYSRKQFERHFSKWMGTSPKQFLKIVRFQHAIDKKSKNKSSNLTDLTYQCGYYDQAHMINDFQQLAGMTPKQYFDVCEPYSDYFQ